MVLQQSTETMKPVLLLFLVLGGLFALAVHGQQPSYYSKDVEQASKSKFTCPREVGVFPDPDHCSFYYMCVRGNGVRRKCQGFLKFDSKTSQCVLPWIAVCFDGKSKSTTSTPSKVTKSVTSSTSDDTIIVCSSFMGTFPHPNDCSKYYSCMMFIPSVKTCPQKQLFDAVKMACKSEGDVHCGTRKRPAGYITTEIPVKSTTISTKEIPVKSTTISTTETPVKSSTISTHIEEKSTETVTITTSKTPNIVSETTETIASTKKVQPTGPPNHNCDEDDLDCIVTETGDVRNWFTCPSDMGSYPHPSSDKLFIFCMNGTPSVKKCGVDLVFSKELLTCVNK